MKKLALAYASMLAMGAMPIRGKVRRDFESITPEKRQRKKEEIYKRNGLSKFHCNGHTVWALNEKSAHRKFEKLGIL